MPSPANLKATAILDYESSLIRKLALALRREHSKDRGLLKASHRYLADSIRPIYTLNELQPASRTISRQRGSCSQRMACLEAIARASDIATRSRALRIDGRFWYPRFRYARALIPKSVLLLWPQFFLDGNWLNFDELYGSLAELGSRATQKFANDGESLFDAVDRTPVDFMAQTCKSPGAAADFDLSRFVLADEGFFDTRDEVFERFGSLQDSLRGRTFEAIFGGRKSL
jgi:hypothetical protein